MKLGREVSRHNELENWRNTHRFESVMATKWLLLTISETEPGLWDRLIGLHYPLASRKDQVGVAFPSSTSTRENFRKGRGIPRTRVGRSHHRFAPLIALGTTSPSL